MTKSTNGLSALFSPADLAARWNVSRKTVGRWIQNGELRVHRLGRQIRVSEEDAISFIAARRR